MESEKVVLVVDDDELIRMLLKDMLEMHGVRVCAADTCRRALAYLRTLRFDAVLLDNRLADGNGLVLLGKVLPFCRCVVMVSADAQAIREQALRLGALAVFPKPFDVNRLLGCLLRSWEAARQSRE